METMHAFTGLDQMIERLLRMTASEGILQRESFSNILPSRIRSLISRPLHGLSVLAPGAMAG